MVKPRSAFSQSEPQYVIFSEELGERRQSYGEPQCWQLRMCVTFMLSLQGSRAFDALIGCQHHRRLFTAASLGRNPDRVREIMAGTP
jgi:hypothetical protein